VAGQNSNDRGSRDQDATHDEALTKKFSIYLPDLFVSPTKICASYPILATVEAVIWVFWWLSQGVQSWHLVDRVKEAGHR
jgi:hypothetical protein